MSMHPVMFPLHELVRGGANIPFGKNDRLRRRSMHRRWILIAAVLLLLLTVPAGLPVRAQGSRKVIQITMVSWKFTPDFFTVTQGDTVVLQLSNEDPDKRNHSFAARWLVGKQVIVRGQVAREGIDDERRVFAVAPGTKGELEFVASEPGSFPFVFGVFYSGSRGHGWALKVLSHAHLDHGGTLPTLVRQGFGGKFWCTPATRDLAALILRDSAEIQHQDVNFANKARARQGQPPLQPLYTIDDAEQAIRRLRPVPYHQTFQVGPATGVFYDAGHILGSAVTVLTVEGRTIVFSGDLGRTAAPIIRDPEFPPAADLLIMEATYGDRRHEPFERGGRKLADVVRGTVRRGGTILIPAFAVGRTPGITYTP